MITSKKKDEKEREREISQLKIVFVRVSSRKKGKKERKDEAKMEERKSKRYLKDKKKLKNAFPKKYRHQFAKRDILMMMWKRFKDENISDEKLIKLCSLSVSKEKNWVWYKKALRLIVNDMAYLYIRRFINRISP